MESTLSDKLKYGAVTLTFCAGLYIITNRITSGLENTTHMFLKWELDIPRIPCFIILYISFYLLLVLSFLSCPTRRELKSLSYQIILSSVIACSCFIILPGELGYTRMESAGVFQPIYGLLFVLDNPTNLFPSLHITLSYVALFFALGQTKRFIWKTGLILWFFGICASVILVHQHHLFDIATGLILGVFVRRVI